MLLMSTAVGYLITSCLNPLCQHYAGIPKMPIMPKAMPAYCACPYSVPLQDLFQGEGVGEGGAFAPSPSPWQLAFPIFAAYQTIFN